MLHLSICLASLLAAAPTVEWTLEPVPADGPAITVRGIVQTPEGKPIAGATVVLRAKIGGQQYSFGVKHNRDVLARTTSDAQGRFGFDSIGIPPRLEDQIVQLLRGEGGAELVAWTDGRALAWSDVKRLTNDAPVKLVLSPEADVRGVVQDGTGRGISGVSVSVTGISPATGELDALFRGPGELNLISSEAAQKAVTGDDGRFILRHMPHDFRLTVAFEHPGHSYDYFVVDTGPESGASEIRFRNAGRDTRPRLRSPLSITLKAGRHVVVKVVDHEGNPVRNGAVQAIDGERHFAGWEEVDERGEARISIAKSGSFSFRYGSDPLQPNLAANVSAEIPADQSTPTIELRLPEPRWLTGRVVDAETGQGIAGAYVGTSVSGADGSFRMPVLAGKVPLSIRHHVYGYFPPAWFNQPDRSKGSSGVTVEVPDSGEIEPVTVSLARGLAVRGTVCDKDGKPVSGVMVHGENVDPPFKRTSTTTDAQGRYELATLSPFVKTTVTVGADDGAFFGNIDGQTDHPWNKTRFAELDIKLEPGVALTGRVTSGGKPRAGVRMQFRRTFGAERNSYYAASETVTDKEGRYRVSGLAPGDCYQFDIVDPDGMVASGWTHQSPYIQTVPEGKAEIELPDAQLVSRGQRLKGVVVDPKGQPVAGVTVSASLVGRRGSLSNTGDGPAPWMETDAKGRFELSQLPDQPIELMAYRANPKGGRILYPAKIRPQLNQQDIRIILDPKLTEDVEDLDAPKKDEPNNDDYPRRLKNCTARSCFSAAARVANVPRFRRLPVLGSFLREYSRYLPDGSLRIMSTTIVAT